MRMHVSVGVTAVAVRKTAELETENMGSATTRITCIIEGIRALEFVG